MLSRLLFIRQVLCKKQYQYLRYSDPISVVIHHLFSCWISSQKKVFIYHFFLHCVQAFRSYSHLGSADAALQEHAIRTAGAQAVNHRAADPGCP